MISLTTALVAATFVKGGLDAVAGDEEEENSGG